LSRAFVRTASPQFPQLSAAHLHISVTGLRNIVLLVIRDLTDQSKEKGLCMWITLHS